MGWRAATAPAVVLLLVLSGCMGPADEPGVGGRGPGISPDEPGDPDEVASHSRVSLHWKQLPSLRVPLRDVACTLHGGDIWVLGGVREGGITENRVDAYDVDDNRWRNKFPLPKQVHGAAAASVDGNLLLLGGYDDLTGRPRQASSDVHVLSSVGVWSQRGDLPSPVAHATAVDRDGAAILVGGTDGDDTSTSVVFWAPNLKDTVHSTHLQSPRVRPAVLPLGESLLVVGGGSGDAAGSGEVVRMDGEEPRSIPDMPTPRSGFAAATAGSFIYVIGGQVDGAAVNHTEIYDADAGIWWPGPPLPNSVYRACAVAAADGIHVLGGVGEGRVQARHWVLTWL